MDTKRGLFNLPVEDEDAYFAIFKVVLMMYVYNLLVLEHGLHAVAGDMHGIVCFCRDKLIGFDYFI